MHRADSPGRIKLMGEETDHVLGYSISLAINLYTVVHAQMHNNVRIYSRSLREVREFDPKNPRRRGTGAMLLRPFSGPSKTRDMRPVV
ncbi:MAG: galactokinase [Thermococcaceae archaeon]|nr:galactokinase [Thermococcaceae archaeon]